MRRYPAFVYGAIHADHQGDARTPSLWLANKIAKNMRCSNKRVQDMMKYYRDQRPELLVKPPR
jgi:hypothetical protein